jgi:hypothetical protein
MIVVDPEHIGVCAKSEKTGSGVLSPGLVAAGWSPAELMMAATARGVELVMVAWMVTWCMFFLYRAWMSNAA